MLALREFEQFYNEMREKYLEYISGFNGSWEDYLENLKKFTCDQNYYPEELLQKFKSEVDGGGRWCSRIDKTEPVALFFLIFYFLFRRIIISSGEK
ncbi:MAG: hypothetical protein ACTSPN_08260 [Promethearchaeota archaeon]